MVLAFATSLLLLNLALKTLPMSITYAVWSGIGSVGGVLVELFVMVKVQIGKDLFV